MCHSICKICLLHFCIPWNRIRIQIELDADLDPDLFYKLCRSETLGRVTEPLVVLLFRFASNFVVWECLRDEEFAPLKNAEGAKGSQTQRPQKSRLPFNLFFWTAVFDIEIVPLNSCIWLSTYLTFHLFFLTAKSLSICSFEQLNLTCNLFLWKAEADFLSSVLLKIWSRLLSTCSLEQLYLTFNSSFWKAEAVFISKLVPLKSWSRHTCKLFFWKSEADFHSTSSVQLVLLISWSRLPCNLFFL